jgi:outer membrane protein OmpA-like peptidoglycan-associated protein
MVCTLPNTPVSALYFQDDSSTLGRREELILKQVADCLIQGPLEGDRVVVFGYADPRGGVDYNLDLAMARARAVRRYLVRWGVSPCNVSVASRGARYARGTGPESWQVDRRAEIHLDQDPVTVSC